MNRFVEKLSGFADMTHAGIHALGAVTARSRAMGARADLIREGDKPGSVLVMLEGWAYRYKILPSGTRQVLAFLMPGDACDLHADLLDEMDHSIQTVTPAQVATINRGEMEGLVDRFPDVARAMYLSQLVDEATLRAWITSMGRRSAIERVAHLMCELFIRARTIGLPVEPTLSLPLSQLLLADALGMTPVHINRVLRELRLAGAMTLSRGRLTIADPSRLVAIAGFDQNYLHRRRRLREAA